MKRYAPLVPVERRPDPAPGSGLQRVGRGLGLGLAVEIAIAASPAVGQARTPGGQEFIRPPEERLTIPQPVPPVIKVPEIKRPERAVPEGAEQVSFTLKDVVLDGATAYEPGELEPLWQDLVGTKVPLTRMIALASEIEARYRADGYFLTRVVVPAQTVAGGVFTFRVVEGYVGQIALTGEVGDVVSLIRSYLHQVETERPLRVSTLERALLLVNDIPGITASAVLRPGSNGPGSAELAVALSKKPLDAAFHVDNRGSRYTGPVSIFGTASANSLTPLGERTTVAGLTSSDLKEQQIYQGGTEVRIGGQGLVLRIEGTYGPSEPGFQLSNSGIETNLLRVRSAAEYPVMRSRTLNLNTSLGFDYIRSKQTAPVGNVSYEDQLRVLWGEIELEQVDPWLGVNKLRFTVRKGLDALGASRSKVPARSRADAIMDFTTFQVEGQRVQTVADGVRLVGKAIMQRSLTALPGVEEFGIGGTAYGRGFDPSEYVGDEGYGASLELRLDPDRLVGFNPGVDHWEIYSFIDWGRIENFNTAVNKKEDIVSAGGGLRFAFTSWLRAALEVAYPINRDLKTRGAANKDPRFLFDIDLLL